MYEKLDKLRAEVDRWRRKLEDVRGKLKEAEEKQSFKSILESKKSKDVDKGVEIVGIV